MFYCGHVDDKHEPVWHLKPPITNYVHGVGFASQCSANQVDTEEEARWWSSSRDGDRTRQTATAGTTTGTTAGTTAAGS